MKPSKESSQIMNVKMLQVGGARSILSEFNKRDVQQGKLCLQVMRKRLG